MRRKQFNKCRWWKDTIKERTYEGIRFWYSKDEEWGKDHNDLKTRILNRKKEILQTCSNEDVKFLEKDINIDMGAHTAIKKQYNQLQPHIDSVTLRTGLDEFAVLNHTGFWFTMYIYDSKTLELMYRIIE